MHIFVSNGTVQYRELHYRVLERPDALRELIPPGAQVELPGDYDGAGLEYVIGELRHNGGVLVADLNSITVPNSLVFSVSAKPIKADVIYEAMEKDDAARQDRSATMIEKAGVAAFTALDKANRGHLSEASTEIVQLKPEERESPEKGGVNAEVIVSKRRGGKPVREKK